MGENSKIEWCDHTFNPWVGCTKVSPGCDHCYAEAQARRFGDAALWRGERRRTSDQNWRQPLKWNARAKAEGVRRRVFCASLADVFDNQVDPAWRCDLWDLIWETPHLDWLLLTKRPQNIRAMLPGATKGALADWNNGWPNVWLGTTVENQAEADRRIPHLLAVPAEKRFLSCEPLVGAVDLTQLPGPDETALDCLRGHCDATEEQRRVRPRRWTADGLISWVICGGESGPGARPMHPDWVRSLSYQCITTRTPFLFKQWGEWAPVCEMDELVTDACYYPAPKSHPEATRKERRPSCVLHADGERFDGQRAAHFGAYQAGKSAMMMFNIGKQLAGATLDGREWREFPT